MDRDVIKALIEALAASDLAELEYRSSNGETLRLVKRTGAQAVAAGPAVAPAPRAAPQPEPAADTVLAPLHGIVHLQRSPGVPPFVAVGQAVAAGQTLCIIEAMKVFNEVRTERDGTVAAVLVRPGEEVEAGAALFRFA